jgi:hypothetical protein
MVRGKNIKIVPAIGGSLPPKRISFSLFEPFNFLLSEVKEKPKCQKNKEVMKNRPRKSSLGPSADPWLALYKILKPFYLSAFDLKS